MNMSIRKQLAIMFISLMAAVLVVSTVVNSLFLENFYNVRKQRVLVQAYEQLNSGVSSEGKISDSDLLAYEDICTANNIMYVVTDDTFHRVLSLEMDEINLGTMIGRLTGYALGFDQELDRHQSKTTVIQQKDNYTIQKKYDSALGLEYLEIWGKLDCGYYFLMRILMESIRDSARISNDFFRYVAMVGILISVILIWIMTKRVTRPLNELTELSKKMAELDFGVRYTSGGKNEIGQLGEHFNEMSEKLEKAYGELRTANNELKKDIEKKEKIDEMRREFLSNVSHELKTPIALVQGYAEGLKECVNDDDPESRDFYCEVIMDEAGKMNSLVRKLLTLNQLEEGYEKVVMERFDLMPLIKGKVSSVSILAQQKNAEIVCEGPDRLPVWGDEFKVEEVITNYLSNALNHVDGERKITVRAEKKADDKVRVSVRNTGTQIPEEDLDQIWDKFYKVDKARTREYGGSGVGLSIVRAIMESFHQDYGVRNLEDGVEFWFELDGGKGM